MIGSLMSRMADAEKLSIQQLQKAVQDGTVPAYVGVPLLQDKLKQEKAATAMQRPAQPPIAQQVMAEAAQHGIDTAPSNLPTQMAGGGIVAFDDGGLANEQDEDEEYGGLNEQDAALLQKYMSAMTAEADDNLDEEGVPEAGIARISPVKKGAAEGIKHDKKGASEGIQYTSKKHKYEKEIREAASKAGISEDLFLHMMAKETGGLENPESARSKAGALGIAQFMPATAKQYGIDPMNMHEALPAAAKMTANLLKHYGGDQRLAAMAYNWGQGNVDKWLATGADPSKVPGETRGYIRAAKGGIMHLAQGGEVKRFGLPNSTDQLVEDDEPTSALGSFIFGDAKKNKEFANQYLEKQKKTREAQAALTAPELNVPFYKAIKPSERAQVEAKRSELLKQIQTNNPAGASTAPVTAAPTNIVGGVNPNPAKEQQQDVDEASNYGTQNVPSQEDIDKKVAEREAMGAGNEDIQSLREMLTERAKSAKNQKSIDNYMALLQAGLGMMGGTSPYAMANIGQGASKGISALADARKSQIAEENALLTGRLGLSRAELLEKSRRDALARQYALDKQNYGLKTRQLGINEARLGQANQKLLLDAEALYDKKGGDIALKQEFAKQYGKNWASDPTKLKLFEAKRNQEVAKLYNLAGASDGYPDASNL